VNFTNTESLFRSSDTTAWGRFFFSSVSRIVPFMEEVWQKIACEMQVSKKIDKNFLIV
jgi:hypothetical protein